MSKKSRKRERQAEREYHTPIANQRLSRPNFVNPHDLLGRHQLVEVEDRRHFHPLDFFQPARNFAGWPAPINVNNSKKAAARPFFKLATPGLKFKAPRSVAMCVRRQERKSVIIAKSKTRKGRGTPKRKNWFSKIGC